MSNIICISTVGDRDVIRMKVSRCEISYLLRGQVVPNFNLQEEMNIVVWECGGLSLVIVPGKCFIAATWMHFFFLACVQTKCPSDHISEELPIFLTFPVVVVLAAVTISHNFTALQHKITIANLQSLDKVIQRSPRQLWDTVRTAFKTSSEVKKKYAITFSLPDHENILW